MAEIKEQTLKELFIKEFGQEPEKVEKLPLQGSNRQYFRMTLDTEKSVTGVAGKSVIGVVGDSLDENKAFIALSNHFVSRGLNMPSVLGVSEDGMCYLQTDLGNRSLFDAISGGRGRGGQYSDDEKRLLKRVIRYLPKIQFDGGRALDFTVCYPQSAFDKDTVMFDLNYFKYCFLKATGLDFDEIRLQRDFESLAEDLISVDNVDKTDNIDNVEKVETLNEIAIPDNTAPPSTFLYRDFQARNIMLDSNDEPWFIDFQSGRRGPFYYDLASFVWQASAKYSAELRQELVDEYYVSLKNYTAVPPREIFNQRLSLFVLFRTLQVLGAYGFRGYFERKKHFIDSIPPAIENLRNSPTLTLPLRGGDEPRYPYLADVLRRLCDSQTAHHNLSYKAETTTVCPPPLRGRAGEGLPLRVRVFSFSYKKGIPSDSSGNGGGYVFDCRSTHNPGRYEPYKKLTGLDKPVIKFLEDDGEILVFLESVYKLADTHVERYIERGFTDLMFSFGCTGGQHRSVYCAQHLAEHLHKKYGIEVVLCHREQGITTTMS